MHPRCPVCDLDFEPEPGYFLGAMYVSYGLGTLTVLPVAMALVIVAGLSLVPILLIATAQTLLTMMLMYRYSRIIWLYVDFALAPR
jgi:hypothetical protein